MASENNATSRADHQENQDQSIKARKVQLFDDGKADEVVEIRRPFSYYVNQTPASPMSPTTKATLLATGVLVVLLFLAALLIGPHRSKKRLSALNPARPAAPGRAQASGFGSSTASNWSNV